MAATYLVLNCTVLVVVLVTMFALRTLTVNRKTLIVMAILLVATLIFDALLIAIDIFGYTPSLILGIRPLGAPVEDFFYSLLAAILIPSVWQYTKKGK